MPVARASGPADPEAREGSSRSSGMAGRLVGGSERATTYGASGIPQWSTKPVAPGATSVDQHRARSHERAVTCVVCGCGPHVHALSLAVVSTSVPRRAARRSTASPSSASAPRLTANARSDTVSRVYQELRGLIVWGHLPPGARIAERAVAERLGLSRTPVRSALHRLQQEGFVSSVGRGQDQRLIVAPLTQEDGREIILIVGPPRGAGGAHGGIAAGRSPEADRGAAARDQPRPRRGVEAAGVRGGSSISIRSFIGRTSRASWVLGCSRCIGRSSRRSSGTRACT